VVEVIVIAIVVALAAAFLVWRLLDRRNGRKRAELPGTGEAPNDPPRKMRIVALGPEAAGKTVLLAGMWKELRIPGGRGLGIDTELDGDRDTLTEMCEMIRDPAQGFPKSTGTGETKEWEFVLREKSPTRLVDVFRFSFLDYAGELVKSLDSSADRDLSAGLLRALGKADIVMGVIDGQKVAHLMKNKPDAGFMQTLSSLSYALWRFEKPAPLHIVITKWDLLQRDYSFQQVRDKLVSSNKDFEDLVRTPRSGLRFIPVSSLGYNGFVHENSDGLMEKSQKDWLPEGVLAPLACAIPDILDTSVQILRADPGEKRMKNGRLIVESSKVSEVFFWATLVLGLAVPYGGVVVAGVRHVLLEESLENLMKVFFRLVKRAGDGPVPARLDDKTAVSRALAVLQTEVEKLEQAGRLAKLTSYKAE
jgi:hypothetical protein